MNLLDPTLAIDLQYLGVRLPIPPPTAPLEPAVQELHPGPVYLSVLHTFKHVTVVTLRSSVLVSIT